MLRLLAKLHHIDRRWLYLATFVLMMIPFIHPVPMPPGKTSTTTKGVYDNLDSCPEDKVILIDSSWHQGSAAENYAQFEAVINHLCMRHIKFVIVSVGIEPIAPQVAQKITEPIAEREGLVYGKDWVNVGYLPAGAPAGAGVAGSPMGILIEGFGEDFHKFFPADIHGTSADDPSLPLLNKMTGADMIHAVFCITYCPDPQWIIAMKGRFQKPVAFACMTIMAPGYMTYIDSGQLCGMLIGNRGAAEYEDLVNKPARGNKLIMASSFGNCCIILAAIVGNIGIWAGRRQKKKEQEK